LKKKRIKSNNNFERNSTQNEFNDNLSGPATRLKRVRGHVYGDVEGPKFQPF